MRDRACVGCRGCARAEVVWNLSRVRCVRIVDVIGLLKARANLIRQAKLVVSAVDGALLPRAPLSGLISWAVPFVGVLSYDVVKIGPKLN